MILDIKTVIIAHNILFLSLQEKRDILRHEI